MQKWKDGKTYNEEELDNWDKRWFQKLNNHVKGWKKL